MSLGFGWGLRSTADNGTSGGELEGLLQLFLSLAGGRIDHGPAATIYRLRPTDKCFCGERPARNTPGAGSLTIKRKEMAQV